MILLAIDAILLISALLFWVLSIKASKIDLNIFQTRVFSILGIISMAGFIILLFFVPEDDLSFDNTFFIIMLIAVGIFIFILLYWIYNIWNESSKKFKLDEKFIDTIKINDDRIAEEIRSLKTQTPFKFKDLDEKKKRVLLSFPVRSPVEWRYEDAMVVISYDKTFSTFEKLLYKIVKGPKKIRRPLDAPGSRIWELCDGNHTILDICIIIDKEFKEKMEPVLVRVIKFIELLLKRNLLVLKESDRLKQLVFRETKKKKRK